MPRSLTHLGISTLMRATTSFSTRKIQVVIDDLSGEVDKVDKLGPIVEARMARGERQDSQRERRLAGLERLENELERKEAAQFRQKVLVEQEIVQYGILFLNLSVLGILTLKYIYRTQLYRDETMA